jgi:uncharacterized protein YjbJ (UPF0337 family)
MGASAQNTSDLLSTLVCGGHRQSAWRSPSSSKFTQEKTMNKDQAKGRAEEVKGKVKEVAGKVTGNKELQQKGTLQNAKGKVQAGFGDLKEDLKKAI